jgi:hypothetical protein
VERNRDAGGDHDRKVIHNHVNLNIGMAPSTRGFFGSVPQMGVTAGMLLGTAALSIVSLLPEPAFSTWGWRIPFWLRKRRRSVSYLVIASAVSLVTTLVTPGLDVTILS